MLPTVAKQYRSERNNDRGSVQLSLVCCNGVSEENRRRKSEQRIIGVFGIIKKRVMPNTPETVGTVKNSVVSCGAGEPEKSIVTAVKTVFPFRYFERLNGIGQNAQTHITNVLSFSPKAPEDSLAINLEVAVELCYSIGTTAQKHNKKNTVYVLAYIYGVGGKF